eukprot:4611837-Lingulodinium_polyedra.AAC.1
MPHTDDTHDYAVSIASSPETWKINPKPGCAAIPGELGRHTGVCGDVLGGFCPDSAQNPGHDQEPQDGSNVGGQ